MGLLIKTSIGCKVFEEKNFLDKTIFVTGSSGFLGTNLINKLNLLNSNIFLIRRPKSKKFKNNNFSSILKIDLTNIDETASAIKKHKPDFIFHLAANSDVNNCIINPHDAISYSTLSILNILESVKKYSQNTKIVVSSSDKAYGPQELPYIESKGLLPKSPYEVSKAISDQISNIYGITYNLKIIITRCGNYFGENDLNWNRIIPGTIKSCFFNKDIILRSNGMFTRDFLNINDAVNSQLLCADILASTDEYNGEQFNFSHQLKLKVIDVVEMIKKISKSKSNVIIQNKTNLEIQDMFVNCDKAKKYLRWKPQYEFKEYLVKTYNWYESYFAKKS